MSSEIWVNTETKGNYYPITIQDEPIEFLKEKILEKIEGDSYLVIIDKNVNKIYGKALGFDNSKKFIMPSGEKYKNFKTYQKIIDKAQDLKLSRKSTIIAIGGGVTGDIAGFVAATYMRGIDYIQVPTTLLACVDSSVGGKTAIDTAQGKNMIGAFHQPRAVFINPQFILTLDDMQFLSGLGEVIKYAFIEKSCDPEHSYGLFDFLNTNSDKVICCEMMFIEKIIEICIKLKTSVVNKDECEIGIRKILNFGHTYGHALEIYTKYKKITHGEAVVIGMQFAFSLASDLNLISEDYKSKAIALIDSFPYPYATPKVKKEKMLEIMRFDKKSSNNKITFILPVEKGMVIEKIIEAQ